MENSTSGLYHNINYYSYSVHMYSVFFVRGVRIPNVLGGPPPQEKHRVCHNEQISWHISRIIRVGKWADVRDKKRYVSLYSTRNHLRVYIPGCGRGTSELSVSK